MYGNTKQLAQAIAEQIEADGHTVEVHNLRDERVRDIDADFMFVGGPTRIKKMTKTVKRFVKKLDDGKWGSKPIVVFDTYGPEGKTEEERKKAEKWLYPGAAGSIQELARKRGLKVHPKFLRGKVIDLKGPLEPGTLEKAKEFAHEVVESLGKT